ncbi:MAG: hypothetical protein C0603_00730 [Denitrovibrio sp.]|nr:MAG: hypothetical protein C0603_00730 [Denitrovibrio sp.]
MPMYAPSVSGGDAESGMARDLYDKLTDTHHKEFEVLTVPVGSPEAFLDADEYLAIDCEDINPVVFLDGIKIINGTEDVRLILERLDKNLL